jgi:hypothetical protein
MNKNKFSVERHFKNKNGQLFSKFSILSLKSKRVQDRQNANFFVCFDIFASKAKIMPDQFLSFCKHI